MKKRSKILMSLAMFVLCCGMLVFGVWSAGSATFNVTSNLSFNPNGVYVHVVGQVKRGETIESATALEGEGYSYNQKNYTAIGGTGADKDKPDGSASTSLGDWTIGNVEFKDDEPVVIYEISITNYSPFTTVVNVDNEYCSVILVASEGFIIVNGEKRDESAFPSEIIVEQNQTLVYQLGYRLTNITEELTPQSVSLSVNIEKYIEPKTFIVSGMLGPTSVILNEKEMVSSVEMEGNTSYVTTASSVCVETNDKLILTVDYEYMNLYAELRVQGYGPTFSPSVPSNINTIFNNALRKTTEDGYVTTITFESFPEIENGYYIYVWYN